MRYNIALSISAFTVIKFSVFKSGNSYQQITLIPLAAISIIVTLNALIKAGIKAVISEDKKRIKK